jgi:RimJ/RimL family protein N-acetyltransferase
VQIHRAGAIDLQPTLVGDLLHLRPLEIGDYAGLYAVAADPKIWEQHQIQDRHEEAGFRSFFEESLESGGALVATLPDGTIIGSSRYHGLQPSISEIEIGWTFLARAYWGGRYNGELKRLMLTHAFRYVDSVVFVVAPANYRSQRAVEKIGGVRDGERTAAIGTESYLYRITRSEYLG